MTTTNLPAVLTQEQQKVFESQSKAWQAKATRAINMSRGLLHTNVTARHELGELVRELAGDENKYGEKAVPMLAIVLGEPSQVLWLCRAFAQTYTIKQLEALLDKAARAGHPLTWSHLRLLVSVEKAQERRELEAFTIEKRLTAADLQIKLNRMYGKRKATGRKHLAPKSPLAAMGQLGKVTNEIVAKSEIWDEMVFSHFDNAGADQVKADDLDAMEVVHKTLVEGYKRLGALKEHSSETLQKLRRRVNRTAATSNGHSNGELKKRSRPDTARILGGKKKAKKKVAVRA